ncbi:phosphate regulon sensor protein PhoR [mine drainage metagenome]|uniref:Phosphate regulon sensor protein PhoR n=1 Tax=mine drainage metagenome TaxID=410659 RepID=A0A1J5SCD1_9ZZZZ
MQDIRWNAFWLSLTLTVICLIIWASYSANVALFVFSAVVSIYLARHLYWLHQLSKWLKKPVLNHIPSGSGIWGDIFASLYQEHRRHSQNQTQLSSALGRFRHAASALPDGVVVLNSNNEIEWCNPPAEIKLGLNLKQDENQPINYLVRHSDFLNYLQAQEYSDPIKLKSWRNSEVTLEIQLIPFGTKQKLLICRDVTQLERIEAMRRDFIANVSHELRTPLTVVGGFIETLMDVEGAVPESTRSYFNMMLDQTTRMRHLIDDLLTLSHIESNVQAPDDAEIQMSALINMMINDAKVLSQGKHKINAEIDANVNLIGAMGELQSAMSNLISNAIRYTPDGGEIHISWGIHNKNAIFSVKDNGIGIDQQHIDRLTERFYRVDRGRSRETGGTGLGLSIVKHILTRHQARLEITSELGVGSTFSEIFPSARIVQKQPDASE